jgi:hypothetical protein
LQKLNKMELIFNTGIETSNGITYAWHNKELYRLPFTSISGKEYGLKKMKKGKGGCYNINGVRTSIGTIIRKTQQINQIKVNVISDNNVPQM